MAALLIFMLIFSMATHSSATWCVCKKGGQDRVLQEVIDYACGNGADCAPTHKGGKCYNPDTVMDHCNYAVNSYFQNKGQAPDSCNFTGAATATTTDPSSGGCTYPTSATRTPGSSTSSIGNNPSNTGVLSSGLGPSASSMDDVSHGGVTLHHQTNTLCSLTIMTIGVVMLMFD